MVSTTTKQSGSIDNASSSWTQVLTFDQFDPSVGLLQGIDLGLATTVAGSVTIESLEAGPSAVTASLTNYTDVFGPTGVLLTSAEVAPSGAAELGANGDSATIALADSTTSEAGWSAGQIDLGNFSGTGTVPLTASGGTSLSVTGPANMAILSHASAGATVTLQYDYTPSNPSQSGSEWDLSGVMMMVQAFAPSLPTGFVTTAAQTFSYADRTTGWSDSVPVARFDPALGTLEAINVTVSADIAASVSAQNEDAVAASIGTAQTATVELGSMLSAAPTVNDFMSLGSGASRADQDLTGTASDSAILVDPDVLAAFSGQGTNLVPITASGSASLSGPGNLAATLLAQAGATVTLSYSYLPVGVTPDSVVWQGWSGGVWSDPNSWSSWATTPQATDDVAITQAGTYTITLDSAETIHSLVVDAPGATLVLDADLLASGNIILDAGTIEFAGGKLSADNFTMNGGAVHGNQVEIDAKGSVAVNAGTIDATGSLTINTGVVAIINGTEIGVTTAVEPLGGTTTPSIGVLGSITPAPIGTPGTLGAAFTLRDAVSLMPTAAPADLLPPVTLGNTSGALPGDGSAGLVGWTQDHPGMLPGVLAMLGHMPS